MKDQFENTKNAITVGGEPITGHTAKPIDPKNPPTRQPKNQPSQSTPGAQPKPKAAN